MALLLLGLWPVLAQSVRLEPTSWETQGASWEQILLELVTAGPAGANLSALVPPEPLSASTGQAPWAPWP